MRTRRFRVASNPAERDQLKRLMSSATARARKSGHARVSPKGDTSLGERSPFDAEIGAAVEVGVGTMEPMRQRFVEDGLEADPTRLGSRPKAPLLTAAYSGLSPSQQTWLSPTCWVGAVERAAAGCLLVHLPQNRGRLRRMAK
jgi:hypothetical protein